jgi:hypothetical protein
MFLLPDVMRKHAIPLRQHAPANTGRGENLHLFCLFIRTRPDVGAACGSLFQSVLLFWRN